MIRQTAPPSSPTQRMKIRAGYTVVARWSLADGWVQLRGPTLPEIFGSLADLMATTSSMIYGNTTPAHLTAATTPLRKEHGRWLAAAAPSTNREFTRQVHWSRTPPQTPLPGQIFRGTSGSSVVMATTVKLRRCLD